MATNPDFVAIRRNDTVTDLVAVSSRARTFLVARRSTGFSRRGLKDLAARGWVIVAKEEYRAAQ